MPRNITQYDITWHYMVSHDVTWHHMSSHYMTLCYMTWHKMRSGHNYLKIWFRTNSVLFSSNNIFGRSLQTEFTCCFIQIRKFKSVSVLKNFESKHKGTTVAKLGFGCDIPWKSWKFFLTKNSWKKYIDKKSWKKLLVKKVLKFWWFFW